MSNVKERPRKQSRSARLARKFKNVLRCEWCNRWTEVGPKKWYKLRKEDALFPAQYTFFCARQSCKAGREEILDSKPS